MKKLILTFFAAACVLCSPAFGQKAKKGSDAKKGWIVMFDGKTFDGWRGYCRQDIPKVWSIEDGCLKISKYDRKDKSIDKGSILFDRKFKNFEFEFEWKVAKGSNSGVFYLASEVPGQEIFMSAPEYQVLDNVNHPDAKLGKDGNRQSSSLYDMIPAKPQNAKPYGEWNTGKIVVKDGLVQHYQNGVKTVEYRLWDDAWKAMVDQSKFKGKESFINIGGANKEGYLALQDHFEDVWFRNLRVRELK